MLQSEFEILSPHPTLLLKTALNLINLVPFSYSTTEFKIFFSWTIVSEWVWSLHLSETSSNFNWLYNIWSIVPNTWYWLEKCVYYRILLLQQTSRLWLPRSLTNTPKPLFIDTGQYDNAEQYLFVQVNVFIWVKPQVVWSPALGRDAFDFSSYQHILLSGIAIWTWGCLWPTFLWCHRCHPGCLHG